ncbi:cupin domain-containing protein [Paracoccus aurantiacus]
MVKTQHFTQSEWERFPETWRGSLTGERMGTEITLAFYETDEIGKGPVLHTHPYPETFIVLDGNGRYQVGDQMIDAVAGDVLIGPPDVPHKFWNLGPGRLRTVDVHHSPVWIQDDLE